MPPPPTLALCFPLSDLIRETSVGRERQATAEPIAITDFINSVAKRRVVVGLGKCGYFRREGNQLLALAFLPSSDMEARLSFRPHIKTSFRRVRLSIRFYGRYRRRPRRM